MKNAIGAAKWQSRHQNISNFPAIKAQGNDTKLGLLSLNTITIILFLSSWNQGFLRFSACCFEMASFGAADKPSIFG